MTAVVVSIVLFAACAAWILRPLFRADAVESERIARKLSERAELLSRKEQLLASLKDLEDDRETEKINEHDYAELHARLTAETAEVLAALDADQARETAQVVRQHPAAVPPQS